ncbi:MAG: beta-N-acetylhexosaminidase [Desulfobulbaceae bacterium]|nr:beta-N-acetylhexosaminidase [Desulfobulbaceae bacterium]
MQHVDAQAAAVGDLFMVGLPGLALDDSTVALVRDCRIHNFILFKRNVADPDQLRQLCEALNDLCRGQGLPLPLISIDQEGGTVARLGPPFTQFPDARVLANSPEPEAAVRDYATVCGRELREVGINMNLAPVLDVCPAGEGRFMERRSLGADPERVGVLGCLIIDDLQAAGVAACVKHFPGLGAAVIDPHLHLPTVSQSRRQLDEIDLAPFRAAAQAGVAAFMTSHTIYSAVDAEHPATLSALILEGILRREIGYDGMVITDDLEMGAIENNGTVAGAAHASFLAGADLLLICHDHAKIRQAHARVLAAVAAGEISAVRLDASRRRIGAVQQRYCAAS